MKVRTFSDGDDLRRFETPVYVGIDASLTGFAVCVLNEHGYDIRVFSSPLTGAARLANIKDSLAQYLANYNIADVFMEGMFVGHRNVANPLGELHGVVKEFLWREYELQPAMVPPSTLKKYVCGTGKAVTKSLIMLNVFKKWGVELSDDNAADAYGLARFCSGAADTAYEAEAVLRMGDPKYR